MSSKRARFSATLLLDGKVLVAGGIDGTFNATDTAEIFDPALASWSLTPPMNDAHAHHTATLLRNGRVLVAGSSNNAAERYAPAR